MENEGFEPDVDSQRKESPAPGLASTSIDMPEKSIPDKPYAGMGKEDLLRFSQTPFWNNFRLVCLIIFWGAWIALLTAVVALTVVAPRCEPPPEQTWWQRTVAYQIYLRSFYDTDGNGIGDLQGVISKLDYIESLNVETIMLSAFYPSHYSEADRESNMGYDVTDHKAIDPAYGNMNDFEELLGMAHERDMKVVIDFIPNHTGDKHEWFVDSAASADPIANDKWNFYVWQDCSSGPPTNWLSVYGESSWVNDPNVARGQCYLNQFFTEKDPGLVATAGYQPDLNLRSSAVRTELESILRYWLDQGVDGFRVVDSMFLFEDADLNDEVEECPDTNNYECRDHSRTTSQTETYELISTWRGILEEYSAEQERILITDARDTINNTMRYYGLQGRSGAHLPLNYQLLQIGDPIPTGTDVQDIIDEYLNNLPGAATADWLTGDQNSQRLASRVPESFTRSMAILKMMLPGPPLIYYGEELDMLSGGNPQDEGDPTGSGRGNYRTVMQWDSTDNAGFQNITGIEDPWIPVNDGYETKNVQVLDGESNSVLNIYRTLSDMRRNENGLAYGTLEYATVDERIFSFVRKFDGTNRFLVAINFGDTGADFNLREGDAEVPGSAELVLSTLDDGVGDREVGQNVGLSNVRLEAGQGAVFMWPFSR